MEHKTYKSYDELPLMLSVQDVAEAGQGKRIPSPENRRQDRGAEGKVHQVGGG